MCACDDQGRERNRRQLPAQVHAAQDFQAGGQRTSIGLAARCDAVAQCPECRGGVLIATCLQREEVAQRAMAVGPESVREPVQHGWLEPVLPVRSVEESRRRGHEHEGLQLARKPSSEFDCHHAAERPAEHGGSSRDERDDGLRQA
jgi:hypothetical protein